MSLFDAPGVFVEVAVALPLDHPFTYRVPAGMELRALPGVRVSVPFGPRKMTGIVLRVVDEPDLGGREAKEVTTFLDAAPYIPEKHLAFLLAAARECLAPVGELLHAALPKALPRRKAPTSSRTETVFAAVPGEPDGAMTEKQRQVHAILSSQGPTAASILDALVVGGAATAKRLVSRGVVSALVREKTVELSPSTFPDATGPVTLNSGQALAFEAIRTAMASGGESTTFVLHGVTGSGKTEVYLRAAREAMDAGRQTLLLVPEIALTPQLLGRVRARFGDAAAVLHSGLTDAERASQWRKVRAGEVSLCVGARSAVFAPFPALGLLVVDEEHDAAYKQEDGIRYQARDLALLRARMDGAVAVLGSATPSAEAMKMTRDGRATLLGLPERIGACGLPEIEIVDLRERRDRRGADRFFSVELEKGVEAALADGKQALLFLNRRGFAPVMACLDCGTTIQCPDCHVSMAWHDDPGALLCHYCHRMAQPPASCGGCGGPKIVSMGLGTERLAGWAAKRFPGARVGRLDSDVTRTRGAYEEILGRMHRGEIDLLVGTQMIAKGHDFPGVTFVGVLLADQSLSFPDFRASERTFQMLTQVSGRAGRADAAGKVVIQTLSPDSPAVRFAAEHDFDRFMDAELSERESLRYPPYGRLVLLRLNGMKEEKVREAASLSAGLVREPLAALGASVLGPAPSPISKVRKMYRFQILLKLPVDFPVGARLPEIVRPARDVARKHGARLDVDVDPYNMLV